MMVRHPCRRGGKVRGSVRVNSIHSITIDPQSTSEILLVIARLRLGLLTSLVSPRRLESVKKRHSRGIALGQGEGGGCQWSPAAIHGSPETQSDPQDRISDSNRLTKWILHQRMDYGERQLKGSEAGPPFSLVPNRSVCLLPSSFFPRSLASNPSFCATKSMPPCSRDHFGPVGSREFPLIKGKHSNRGCPVPVRGLSPYSNWLLSSRHTPPASSRPADRSRKSMLLRF